MNKWRSIINVGIAVASLLAINGLNAAAWFNRFDPVFAELVVRDFAEVTGLSFAFIGAFIVATLFQKSEAHTNNYMLLPINFEFKQ